MTAGGITPIEGARRAFVVRFATRGGPGHRRFSGRGEHLVSDESMRSSSLTGLLAFFAALGRHCLRRHARRP
jgi:hypothetical protein